MSNLVALLLIIRVITLLAMPLDSITTVSFIPIERCQNGRVCMNTCYLNEQLTDCNETNSLKPILFNPPFYKNIPSINLQLIQIDENNEINNSDIIIEKENLTSYGMNIRFSHSINSTICVNWIACLLDND